MIKIAIVLFSIEIALILKSVIEFARRDRFGALLTSQDLEES